MFEKIGRFITKRYKLVVIAWVLAVLIALPFAPQVFDVLQYNETEMAPSNIESQVAQDFINDHFGNVSDQGTTIIVLRGSNVLDNETRNIVSKIDEGLFNASHFGGIDALVSVDSLYSSGKLYLVEFLQGASANLATVVERTNNSAKMIFGLPLQFQSLYESANQTAFMIYGIPDIYDQTWRSVDADGSIQVADNLTYAAVKDILPSKISDLNSSQQALFNHWLAAFTQAWNATASMPSISSDPTQRARIGQAEAFLPFLQTTSGYLSSEEVELLRGVNSSFNLSTYGNFHLLSEFSASLLNQKLEFNWRNASQDERNLVQGYLSAFYGIWNSSEFLPKQDDLKDMVSLAVSHLAQSVSSEEVDFLQSVHSDIGWSGWNNSSAINGFASEAFATSSRAQPWLVDELMVAGPNLSTGEIMELATRLMANSSVSSFPLPFPQDLIKSFVSSGNNTMIIALTYASPTGGAADGKAYVQQVREVIREAVEGTSIASYVTGSDPIGKDMEGSLTDDLHIIEPVTIILVLVLIGLYFRSFVASSIPPLFIGLALGIAFALVFFIGTFLLGIHYSVVTLMLTSMMGAGCDYCIFILSRYREERRSGREKEVAVQTSVTWAGESIATSGATVIIGFGVLSLGRYAMLQSMGISLALGVTIALLAALTLLPAALMLAGDKIFWPAKLGPWVRSKKQSAGYFTHSAKFAIKHAKIIIVTAILISIPATYLIYTLDTSYDFIAAMPQTESKQGLEVMTADFGGGRMMPTYVALNMTGPIILGDSFNITQLDAIENISALIASAQNVKQVTSPTRPMGESINYGNLSSYSSEEAAQLKASMLRMIGNDGRSVLMYVVLADEPFAQTSIHSISDLRQIASQAPRSEASIQSMYVGGSTASMKDISDMVGIDFSTIEMVVVIGIYVVLLVVLGSMINPLRSIITILLSISWTLALTMLVFQFFLHQPILWLLPMILLVVCLGLGMDYDILLTTRIREEASKGRSENDAIVHAVERTGGIITACGIIMAAAFASMMISESALLKEFGFALMFATLLDATVVRIYLVPAIMSLLGKWNWWAPGPLQRRSVKQMRKLEELQPIPGQVDPIPIKK